MAYPSNMEFPRRIVIDDTDPRVKYEAGNWSLDNAGTFDGLSSNGAAFKHTMHGTNEDTASFSFAFEGEYVSVWGAKDTRKVQPNGATDDLTKLAQWRCQVDGSPIQHVNYLTPITRITNNLLCEGGGLSPDTPHVLTLNVSIQDPETQMFWLDKIEYTPGTNVNVAGEVMKFDSSDANVRYDNNSGSWITDSGPLFNQTDTRGATMSFRFNGTSVSLYGFNEGDPDPYAASTARYNIDGSHEINFVSPASRPSPANHSGRIDHFNELLFTSPDLDPGTHDLTVTFTDMPTGKEWIQWLTIDYFYVTASAGTGADGEKSGSTSGGSKPGEQSGSASGGSESGKTPVGAIVGGVVGGVAVLVLLGLGVFFFLRRRKRSRDAELTAGSGGYISSSSGANGVSPYPYSMLSVSKNSSPRKAAVSTPDPYPDDVGAASTSSENRTSTGAPGSTLWDMQDAQRAAVREDVLERRHYDSGIRYPQTQHFVDIPPDYTSQ
ncbi:hypothetical protein VNI00_017237 [Paramarasmius palmivorus]|uniref:receptor protein-tyrosine kinase n=1 Tax=Paramarasmius palmivorus TaxID=297713 RepID=A0AAW0B7D8_9AGAR